MQTWPATNTPPSSEAAEQRTDATQAVPPRRWGWSRTQRRAPAPLPPTAGGHPTPAWGNQTRPLFRKGKAGTFSKVYKPETGTWLSLPTG